jgi:biopolymer transport protein ExbB
MAPAAATMVATGVLPRDLSPWGMFLNADIVVKVVMVGLVLASIVTWTAWLAKSIELWSAKRKVRAAVELFGQAYTLVDARRKIHAHTLAEATRMRSTIIAYKPMRKLMRVIVADVPVRKLLGTAMDEMGKSPHVDPVSLKECISWLLERLEVAAGRQIGRGMGVLASIGATAPFVGLFGTVWGIMNSFIGISNAHTTNLAVVAPGIAEALLATALGLFAAIPAVVIYNVFARQIGGYRALLADAGALVMRLVSRDCERRPVARARAAE